MGALLTIGGLWRTLLPVVASLVAATPAAGQVAGPARPAAELRLDATAAAIDVAQVTAGLQVPSGTYLRVAFLAGAGRSWQHGASAWSARFEGQGRFHLDPYREVSHGAYGIGGILLAWDRFAGWEPRLVLGAGVELPGDGGPAWALEAALAGGLRVSIVLRGASPDRR